MATVGDIMTREVICIDMDVTLGSALELCERHRIRHLPVVDESKRLVGVVTDRDLHSKISPRLGTIAENNADRETLHFRVHRIMGRNVISISADTTVADAAQLMLEHRIGCLPVVNDELGIVGIITTSDLLRHIAQNR
jgi:acetoin utilization protein AcuB